MTVRVNPVDKRLLPIDVHQLESREMKNFDFITQAYNNVCDVIFESASMLNVYHERYMDSITILTSTVVAALVTAIISAVKSFMDSRAKSNDSVRLFGYTKLYEIMHELSKENMESSGKTYFVARTVYRENIIRACGMAKPLVEKKYWLNIDVKIDLGGRYLADIHETNLIDAFIEGYDESINALEAAFNLAVEAQMKLLLKSK